MNSGDEHPEQRSTEKFIGNFTHEDFVKCDIKGKRRGDRAYDESGKDIPYSLYPVFVPKNA
jgi:hypothetical protein